MDFASFKNKHKGERCVLMGNGPSLLKTDWRLLEGEMVIGLNKIFLLYDKTHIRADYVVCYIPSVVEQNVEAFAALDVPLFLAPESKDLFWNSDKKDIFYFGPHERYSFSNEPQTRICSGATVTYVALQLLYYMGFEKVALIGVDHSFNYKGPPDKWFKIKEADPNHFDPKYFDKGQLWQAPNLEKQNVHYEMARLAFDEAGCEVVDATDGGKLQVFRKATLKEVLSEPVARVKLENGELEDSGLYSAAEGHTGIGSRSMGVEAHRVMPEAKRVLLVFSDRNYEAVREIEALYPGCEVDVVIPKKLLTDFEQKIGEFEGLVFPESGPLDHRALPGEFTLALRGKDYDCALYTCSAGGVFDNVVDFLRSVLVGNDSIPIFGYSGMGRFVGASEAKRLSQTGKVISLDEDPVLVAVSDRNGQAVAELLALYPRASFDVIVSQTLKDFVFVKSERITWIELPATQRMSAASLDEERISYCRGKRYQAAYCTASVEGDRRNIHSLLAYLGPTEIRAYKGLGVWEIEEMQPLQRSSCFGSIQQLSKQGFDPAVVIDVGAAFGDWARMAMEAFPRAKVFGIEPVPVYGKSLRALELGSVSFEWVQAALSDEEGEIEMNVHPNVTSSSLLQEEAGRDEDGEPQMVHVRTLDNLFDGNLEQGPVLLKTDTQGLDLKVLQGGEAVLNVVEVVVCEAFLIPFLKGACSLRELINHLWEQGFDLHDITNLTYRPLDDALAQVDLVFVKRGKFGRDQLVFADPDQRKERVDAFVERMEKRLS